MPKPVVPDPLRVTLYHKLNALYSDLVLSNGLKVYFRPPNTNILSYPCIVYDRSNYPTVYGNDVPYVVGEQFEVTFISNEPGLDRGVDILNLPNSSHSTTFRQDNLVHEVFVVYMKSATS